MEELDTIKWTAHARIDKFTAEQEDEAKIIAEAKGITLYEALQTLTPYESLNSPGNSLTRIGLRRTMGRLVADATNSSQGLDSTHTRIGAGDGSTAFANTDTDLSAAAGSTHRWFQLVSTAPTSGSGASSGVGTFAAVFGTADGNFAWAEWGIDGGTASGNTVTTEGNTTPGLINRKVVALGTKTSAASWTFTVTITLT